MLHIILLKLGLHRLEKVFAHTHISLRGGNPNPSLEFRGYFRPDGLGPVGHIMSFNSRTFNSLYTVAVGIYEFLTVLRLTLLSSNKQFHLAMLNMVVDDEFTAGVGSTKNKGHRTVGLWGDEKPIWLEKPVGGRGSLIAFYLVALFLEKVVREIAQQLGHLLVSLCGLDSEGRLFRWSDARDELFRPVHMWKSCRWHVYTLFQTATGTAWISNSLPGAKELRCYYVSEGNVGWITR